MINLSLNSSTVPSSFKVAQLLAILKKPHLDKDELNNYQPISNLPYISKLLELVIASQLVTHLQEHNLADPFQSAYRKIHSTETALTFVNNEILMSLDSCRTVPLILLDLSAAFDTVDHTILLNRLQHHLGISLPVLKSHIWTGPHTIHHLHPPPRQHCSQVQPGISCLCWQHPALPLLWPLLPLWQVLGLSHHPKLQFRDLWLDGL